MDRILGRFEPQAYAVFRIVFGLLFFHHGTQKLFGWPGAGHGALPPLIQVAAWIELLGGFLVMIGLFASLAAFICCGQMAVAYFTAHQPGGLWPIVNKGELAVLYCFAFLIVAAWWLASHGAR